MVNLELYRVFYTVAKCGSLTKAAEELYISQPAVSQSIKQLENQLGISLFNRTTAAWSCRRRVKVIFPK
ncbi:MAG: LysR family transcriptional regulator [Christensenellaceae bacterium]